MSLLFSPSEIFFFLHSARFSTRICLHLLLLISLEYPDVTCEAPGGYSLSVRCLNFPSDHSRSKRLFPGVNMSTRMNNKQAVLETKRLRDERPLIIHREKKHSILTVGGSEFRTVIQGRAVSRFSSSRVNQGHNFQETSKVVKSHHLTPDPATLPSTCPSSKTSVASQDPLPASTAVSVGINLHLSANALNPPPRKPNKQTKKPLSHVITAISMMSHNQGRQPLYQYLAKSATVTSITW